MNTLTHGMTINRYRELRRILKERRDEMAGEVQDKIRLARAEGGQMSTRRVADANENSETDIQDDIEFALLQMKAETLTKISAALGRLEEGTYGYCYECGDEIGEGRLRALPFAARCKDCEEVRENEQNRARVLESRSKAVFLSGTPSV
jgi:DnaK suppressor protein